MVLVVKSRFLAIVLSLLLIFAAIFTAGYISEKDSFEYVGTNTVPEVKLPIIMYHQVTDNSKLWSKYAISSAQLESDFKYLKEKGYKAITMAQLIAYCEGKGEMPEKPIIISFDDGYESFVTLVEPLLEKYDMYAVLAIIGSAADLFTKVEDHHLDYSHLSWPQIEALSKNPRVELQNHTYDLHTSDKGRKGCMRKSGESLQHYEAVVKTDIEKQQNLLYEHTGRKPDTMVFPFGAFSDETVEIVKEMGFKAVFTCREKVNYIKQGESSLYSLGRFNRAHGKSSEEFFKCLETD